MAGLGKYKKGAAFTLKSGNKPTFQQMGSGSPLDKTLIGNQKNLPDHLRAKIEDAPGKMYDTPGKMYNAPLKAEDNTEINPKAEVPEETEEEKKAREEKEKKEKEEPVKPRDSNMAMAGKFLANMTMGGLHGIGAIDKHSLAINYGPEKGEKESEALTIEQKMLKHGYELGDLSKAKKDKEKKSEYSGFGYNPNYKNPFKK